MADNYTPEDLRQPETGAAQLRFDEDGFLIDYRTWTEETGQLIAALDGVGPLCSSHWVVIHYIRDRFLRFGAIPPMRNVCRASALARHDVERLFGGCRQAWRIAGLPNPGEEAKAYMN